MKKLKPMVATSAVKIQFSPDHLYAIDNISKSFADIRTTVARTVYSLARSRQKTSDSTFAVVEALIRTNIEAFEDALNNPNDYMDDADLDREFEELDI